MIYYYCRACQKPVAAGIRMCDCGEVYENAVPESPDKSGEGVVVYWPPQSATSTDYRLKAALDKWNGLPIKTQIGIP